MKSLELMSRASSGVSTPASRNTLSRQTSSPLRPGSPTSIRSFPDAAMAVNARRSSTPNAATLTKGPSPTSTPPPGGGGKSRARDLLRKHYGLGVGPPPALQGKSAVDPMDLGERTSKSSTCECLIDNSSTLDSPAFDAKAYYEQLITTSSLPTLLKRENELMSGWYRVLQPFMWQYLILLMPRGKTAGQRATIVGV